MRKPKRKQSIARKFFITMSTVAVFFMLLLFASTSFFYYRRLVIQESETTYHQLDFIAGQLQYYLISADNYFKTIAADSDVQSFVEDYYLRRDTTGVLDIRVIKKRVNSIIQSTPFIHSVSVYSRDGALIAATDPFPLAAGKTSFLPENRANYFVAFKHPYTTKKDRIEVLSMIRPFYGIPSGEIAGYVEIAIPETVIADIYQDNLSKGAHIYMTDGRGYIRSSDQPGLLGTGYPFFDRITGRTQDAFFAGNSIVYSRCFDTLGWRIVYEIEISRFLMSLASVSLIAALLVLLCIALCVAVSHRVSGSITSPIEHLIRHTKKIQDGSWVPIEKVESDTEISMLFDSFNSMLVSQEQLKNDLMESERRKQQIMLDLLQQQINPHFLYNTLDNICSLAEIGENETLIQIVMNLSAFYRLGLGNGRTFVTVKDELELTGTYLDIMKVRYFHKFDYAIHCPEALGRYGCIKLLLQPIVENSIYHGIKEIDYPGHIEIRVSETGNTIVFIVCDNGTGFTEEAYEKIWQDDSGNLGVKNIHQRIQLYYGSAYGLRMENLSEGGCRTTITIGREELILNEE